LKIGISQKKTKSPTKKKLQGYQLFGFSRFLHHTLLGYSASFYRKNRCLGALERYFIEKNSINKKPNSNNLQKTIWFESLEMELLKIHFFKKSKKN
jgi:hypothetical protein